MSAPLRQVLSTAVWVLPAVAVVGILVYVFQLLLAPAPPAVQKSVLKPPPASVPSDHSSSLPGEQFPSVPPAAESAPTPTPHLPALKRAMRHLDEIELSADRAIREVREGDIEVADSHLTDALTTIPTVWGDIRDGVGGDFDLGKLPESDPLRRVGSARQSLRKARTHFQRAKSMLAGKNISQSAAAAEIESGMLIVQGSRAKLRKALRQLS
jgi:hypothetical protein